MLLKILSPRQIPNKRMSWNRYIRMYYWLIKRLQNSYCRSAISDAINIGDVQIIHNVRDYWYEQELQRFHIDTAQHLERSSAPYNLKQKFRRSSLFTWSESLLIFHNGKSYNVKRSNNFSIESDIDGLLKVSGEKDFILRSEFTVTFTKPRKNNTGEEIGDGTVSGQEYRKQSQHKVSAKDTIPVASSSIESSAETVKYRGFEESSIF